MYNIPSEVKKYYYEISDFKGVDFTTSPLQVDKKRSPNAKNIINNDGFNETRKGYSVLNTIGNKINGVWNIDTDIGDLFLVHSGTNLYQCTSDFSSSTIILSGMTNNRSTGVYFDEYLLIFDGTRAVVFSKFDGINYSAKFLDECGYIPTISINRDENGKGTDYELRNLVSPYVVDMFATKQIETGLDDEGNPTYKDWDTCILSEQNIDSIVSVEKLNSNAEWELVSQNEYTFDLVSGKVFYKPGNNVLLGSNNVKITYLHDLQVKDKINKCTIATLYGYEGNNDRIFVTGNPELANYDYWCEQSNPLYWPDENFAKIGVEPIVSYSKMNDGTLAVLKRHSDTDNTIYYRNYNLLNDVEVFPLKDGTKNIGCISSYANANLLNDPLFLSNQGVFAVVSNNDEKYAMQRSYYVNGRLLKEANLENAIGIAVDGKYYIGINNHVYIADSRYLSYPKHSKTEQYQYEWWYWDNIPARVFFSWNNKLYFGTENGEICSFTNEYLDKDIPVEAYYETPFLDLDSNRYAKTIKRVDLFLNPVSNEEITFGYKLDDGDSEIITRIYENTNNNFPRTISEKERIKKFMFIKFYMSNDTNKVMSFERLGCEYVLAGRYKGE